MHSHTHTQPADTLWGAEAVALKVKSGKDGRGNIHSLVGRRQGIIQHEKERGSALQDGKEKGVREIDCPRVCPRPVVRLHQSSAKRTGRTEEAGKV